MLTKYILSVGQNFPLWWEFFKKTHTQAQTNDLVSSCIPVRNKVRCDCWHASMNNSWPKKRTYSRSAAHVGLVKRVWRAPMLTLASPEWSLWGAGAAAITYAMRHHGQRDSNILPSAWVVTFGGKKTKRPRRPSTNIRFSWGQLGADSNKQARPSVRRPFKSAERVGGSQWQHQLWYFPCLFTRTKVYLLLLFLPEWGMTFFIVPAGVRVWGTILWVRLSQHAAWPGKPGLASWRTNSFKETTTTTTQRHVSIMLGRPKSGKQSTSCTFVHLAATFMMCKIPIWAQ